MKGLPLMSLSMGSSINIKETISNCGVMLIKNCFTDMDISELDQFTTNVFGPSIDYVGGTSPRQKLGQSVYEATRLPDSYSILLHQEMSYLTQMPMFICFFMKNPANSGGASIIGDMTKVIDLLPTDVWNYFKDQHLRLKRVLFSETSQYFRKDVHKSWQEVFFTKKQDEVERVAAERGWPIRWLAHEALELFQDAHPCTRYHPGLKNEIWCNQLHIFHLACQKLWAIRDGRNKSYSELEHAEKHYIEYLDQMVFEDKSEIDMDMACKVFETVAQSETAIDMQKGDVLILDNLRFGHGRQKFKGPRQLFVTMH